MPYMTMSEPDARPMKEIVGWHLGPAYARRYTVPFKQIMESLKAGLRAGCADQELAGSLRAALGDDEELLAAIDPDAPVSGGPLARPELVFEPSSHWRLALVGMTSARTAPVWRIAEDGVRSGGWRAPLRAVRQLHVISPAHSGTAASASGGRLMRREHASVEFESPQGTRIIFDPVFFSAAMGYATTMPIPRPGIRAAFVTHSHLDHFDVATLDYLAASGAVVYVPEVPVNSVLSEDMYGILGACGIASARCAPGSITTIDDVTIEALPFFGEQPSACISPAYAGIRNWGCCYRVDSAGCSALMLADSGSDPAGTMLAAIADSVRRRGPIDVILGCLRDIWLPFEIEGLPTYYSVLPLSGIRSDYDLLRRGKLQPATLGVAGMAAACAEAKAKVFLPYAHGLSGYRRPIEDNPFGPGLGASESRMCYLLAQEIKRIGAATAVDSWNPGDYWAPGRM
jgi:hypothetical protein